MPDRGLTAEQLALLSHEIRGALTVVNGFSELLRRPLDDDHHVEALDGISRAVRRIDSLLKSALEGDLVHNSGFEPVDLREIALSVALEQRTVTGRTVEVAADEPLYVLGSPDALERALGNLVDNGLKYSLGSSSVDITLERDGHHARLCVADRGPGIPSEMRDTVLQPFERLPEHREIPGTGLGLTVVRSVVEAHGGRFEIGERAGGGSIMCLVLPIAEGGRATVEQDRG